MEIQRKRWLLWQPQGPIDLQGKLVITITPSVLIVFSETCFSFARCHFVLVFFSPLSTGSTSIGEEKANLDAFLRLFDLRLFGFVCFLSSRKHAYIILTPLNPTLI